MSEWRIHIGAHKTASTHLQNTMGACASRLLEKGVVYLPHTEVRRRVSKVTPKDHWRFFFTNWIRQKFAKSIIAQEHYGADTIVFSEENVLGGLSDLLLPSVYPNIYKRFTFIRRLLEREPVTLFLSIRSFDRILPGVYATALKHGPAIIDVLHAYQETKSASLPSWVDVIERIKFAAPGAKLRIWRQEDYRENMQYIISEFSGISINDIPDVAPPLGTVTPSAYAIHKVEDLNEKGLIPHNSWEESVMKIYKDNPVRNKIERYSFMTSAQHKRLQISYEKDLNEIKSRWPDLLIT